MIKKIGVIGEGKMGLSIFLYLNGFDFHLTWLCSSESAMESALKTFLKKTKLRFQSDILAEEEYTAKIKKTLVTASMADLKDCDLIIEAINEDVDTKRKLFDSLDKVVKKDCILASNSSSILPSLLIPPESRKDKVAGLHFFFQVALKKTVELISNVSTSLETIELLRQFLLQINKWPFHQDEANAFILNRLLLDFQAEAFNILSEGKLNCKEIDELVKQHLFPIGAFEFFDHVGIDVMLSSVNSYIKNSENKNFYAQLIQKLEEKVKLNHLGIKTKQGFYDYSNHLAPSQENRNTTNETAGYKASSIDRLWKYYDESVLSVIESGLCTREELALYVKDYMGMDRDPFTKMN
jgi:3-hydroxybutyryl-CoA dehydrogenase